MWFLKCNFYIILLIGIFQLTYWYYVNIGAGAIRQHAITLPKFPNIYVSMGRD